MTLIINKKSQDLVFIEASGFSMWPFIKQGEKLIIKKVPIEDLRVGDIILYRTNANLVCHRLVKKIREGKRKILYARGDNSSQFEPITEEMFSGKVIATIRNGKVLNLMHPRQQLFNRIIIIISPLISCGIKIGKAVLGKQ